MLIYIIIDDYEIIAYILITNWHAKKIPPQSLPGMAFPPGFSMPVGDIARPRAGRWRHRGGGASQGVETQSCSVPGSYLLVNITLQPW